jgi:lambda family phage portal protein
MIFDDLMPGEDIGTIDTNRPNQQLEPHRKGQLRAVAAGTYCSYSSLARDYNGTYSAQRQELVESYGVYGQLQAHVIGQLIQPVYERAIDLAKTAGLLAVPAGVRAETLDDALYLAPSMPWIDPLKEASAWEKLEANVHASGPEIIRRRGLNPRDVIEQAVAWEADKQRVREARGPTETQAHAQARPKAVR